MQNDELYQQYNKTYILMKSPTQRKGENSKLDGCQHMVNPTFDLSVWGLQGPPDPNNSYVVLLNNEKLSCTGPV